MYNPRAKWKYSFSYSYISSMLAQCITLTLICSTFEICINHMLDRSICFHANK